MKVKETIVTLLSGVSLSYGQAFGPNTPPVGSIVPDSMTFSMSSTSPAELNNLVSANVYGFEFSDLETKRYSDFPNEVVVTLYFTPW